MSIVQSYPGQVLPEQWIFGYSFTLSSTTPNTQLTIQAGICRDSNNVIDICVGAANANFEGQVVAAPLTLNALGNGANGLDSGSLAASSVYAVYVIGDSTYNLSSASLLSLQSNTYPTMPKGYDSYRIIGYVVTDASTHFLPFQMSGVSNDRTFIFDAPQASPITTGNATSYTAVNLIALVPNVNNTPVILNCALTPGAASRTLKLQSGNAVGDQVTITGQVTSVIVTQQVTVEAQPTVISTVSSPTVNYKVANSGDAAAISVAGFKVSV